MTHIAKIFYYGLWWKERYAHWLLVVLDPTKPSKDVAAVFKRNERAMIDEILAASADAGKFYLPDFYPVVRFKMDSTVIFDELKLINELKKGRKYNRFKPYIVNSTLQELLDKLVSTEDFVFSPGKRSVKTNGYTKNTERRTIKIAELHKQIIDRLELHLSPEFTVDKKNLSIEKTTFGNNIADIVIKEKGDVYSIIEIKTSTNLRASLRDALGQLLDYALWSGKFSVKSLIIVSPAELSNDYVRFFERIKNTINFEIKYWQYKIESNGRSQIIEAI